MTWRGGVAVVGAVVALATSSIGWQRETLPAVRADTGSPDAALFRAKGCAACHDGPDSAGFGGFPSLADARSWAGTRREGLTPADYLAESIREPWAFRSPAFRAAGGPVDAMPMLGLDEAEIAAIVRYLLGET
jgi:mono/diheme cytochrome c family protein